MPGVRFVTGAAARTASFLSRLYKGGWGAMMFGALGMTGALLAMAWAVVIDRIESEERILLNSAAREQENVAFIVAENLSHVLDRGRRMAFVVADGRAATAVLPERRLVDMLAVDSAYLRVALYGRHGGRISSSANAPDSAAIRSAVDKILADDAGDAVVLAPDPAGGREQSWQVPVVFPVLGSDGRPAAALLCVLDLGYLLGLFQNVDIGRTGAISVFRPDGAPLAEMRRAGLLLVPERVPPLAGDEATSTGRVRIGGAEHLISFRRLDSFPMQVAVSREVEDIRAGRGGAHAWMREALGGLSVAIALAALWVIGSLYRQSQLLQSLKQANRSNRELIAQLEDEKKRAFQLASNDHLTGLYNRRMFNELAASHLSRARRSHKHYAVMYLDLDRFKGVNDTLGHHVGDLLLKAVAERLRGLLRESDVVARLGGDEFAVLLTGLERVADAEAIAVKLVRAIGEPCCDLEGHDLQVATSIGIAIYPRDGQNIDILCRHADAAMYEAKRAGRGRFAFYDAALNPAGEWLFELEQRLPRAIAEDELVLHFQPKVSLTDFRITGLEALVRWQHPEHGLIFPKDFVEIAESTGDIVRLGEWVAEACCRQQAVWRAAGAPIVPIAVNVSPRQLLDAEFAGFIETTLSDYGLAGSLLEVEITESALMGSVNEAGRVLRKLQALGVRVALDDFGNGFSNLSYIRSLPIHTLKIDRCFVSDLRNSHDDEVIVGSIITLAHNLRMRVVAEGVETIDQIVHLKAAGCDEIQGYYLSRPVTADLAFNLLLRSTLEPG